jgi:GDSL-like Lipase/Acylhydrolase.
MKKRFIAMLLCLVMLLSATVVLSACKDDDQDEESGKVKILFLGDSIAEGIIGPSPLTEREDLAYYGIVGQINDYVFVNQSVSGHQTKDMVQMLSTAEYYRAASASWKDSADVTAADLAKDDGAYSRITHIKNADIIHLSIIGNDLLQAGEYFNTIILEAAETPANFDFVDSALSESVFKFKRVMQILRLLNPTADIILQSVYNPIFPNTPLLSSEVIADLADMGCDTNDEIRALGDLIIPRMNKVIFDYYEANKASDSKLHFIDVYGKFKAIYDAESEHTRGYSLFYTDGVHPSNEGHAVIADLIQVELESLGLAKADTALAQYKELRVRQLTKGIYTDNIGTRLDTAVAAVNAADSYDSLTEIFFDQIEGIAPKYGRGSLEQGADRYFISSNSTYRFANGTTLGLLPGILGNAVVSLLDKDNSGITLNTDGTMTIDISLDINQLNEDINKDPLKGLLFDLLELDEAGVSSDDDLDIATLLVTLLNKTDEEGNSVGIDLTTFVDQYVKGLFPGFDLTNVEDSIALLPASAGLGLVVDRTEGDGISKLIAAVEDNPSNFVIPSDLTLPDRITIRYSGFYYLKDVDTDIGKQTGVFIGKHNADSEPFLVMTKYVEVNESTGEQKEMLKGRIEFIKTSIVCTKVIA